MPNENQELQIDEASTDKYFIFFLAKAEFSPVQEA